MSPSTKLEQEGFRPSYSTQHYVEYCSTKISTNSRLHLAITLSNLNHCTSTHRTRTTRSSRNTRIGPGHCPSACSNASLKATRAATAAIGTLSRMASRRSLTSASTRQLSAYLQRLSIPSEATDRVNSPLHVRVAHGLRPGAITAELAAGAEGRYLGGGQLNAFVRGLPSDSQSAILSGLVAHRPGARLAARMRADAMSTPGMSATAAAAGGALRTLVDGVRARRVGPCAPPALKSALAAAAARAPHSHPPFCERLAGGARVFAAFHPAAPGVPLAVAESARLPGLPRTAKDVLVPANAPSGGVAVFYSVVSAHAGLAGLGVPARLIREAARLEAAAGARRTVTLSPIPGFRAWVRRVEPAMEAEFDGREREEELRVMLRRYLVEEKRRGGAARDPVANFHLRNGARIEAILLGGDKGPRRMRESFGAMVVYEYCKEDMEKNACLYAQEKIVHSNC